MSAQSTPYDRDPSVVSQIGMLAARSISRVSRTPQVVVPTLVFPLIFLAVNSGGLAKAVNIPGFPTDSFVSFALAMTFLQSSMFATSYVSQAIAEDIESGFLNRLSLTPMRGAAVVVAQLAAAAAIGAFAATVFIVIGLIAGVRFETGIPGIVATIVLASLTAMALGSLGAWMALRTGSSEEAQGLFPLLFAAFFISSLNMPRELMTVDWFRAVASANPISYLVEGLRSLVIVGWDAGALGRDALSIVGVMTVGLVGSARGIRRRMERT